MYWPARGGGVRAILTWHSIDPSGSPISVSQEELEQQMACLAARGIQVLPLEALLALSDHTDAVALTFDDGFANFEAAAVPVLRNRGWPATLFVVTGCVGRDNTWGHPPRADPGIPTLPLLGWDALGRLRESGFAIGAHSRTHQRLTRLSHDALEEELGLAAEDLKRQLGESPTGLAYPYGDFDEPVTEMASRYYRWACTTELRTLNGHPTALRLPRIDTYYLRDAKLFKNWGSSRFRAWIWSRRQARRVRARFSPGTQQSPPP